VNYKATASIQFTQQSIAIGAVVAILLALCLGFCLFNLTRLRRQHRNLNQRRAVLRAIPQDPEHVHAAWAREARTDFSPKRGCYPITNAVRALLWNSTYRMGDGITSTFGGEICIV
jgi:alkyl hydroperoxide reductase subunit AhpC